MCANRGADLGKDAFNWIELLLCSCQQCLRILGCIGMQCCQPNRRLAFGLLNYQFKYAVVCLAFRADALDAFDTAILDGEQWLPLSLRRLQARAPQPAPENQAPLPQTGYPQYGLFLQPSPSILLPGQQT